MPDTPLARLAPVERRALVALAAAWLTGVLAGGLGLDRRLAAWSERRLDPPLPSPGELAERLPPGDPRPAWLAAGLALRAERSRAALAPMAVDPNDAARADWDRLPGIGPRLAEAIVGHRTRRGPFRGPADLLAVRGVGPRTLERLAPYLAWGPETAAVGPLDEAGRRDLNRVDEPFLAGLPGIGPKLATAIVRERRRRGGFRAWADVLRIEGIGASRLAALQNATRLAGERPPAAAADSS